jgi:hypothetical protein
MVKSLLRKTMKQKTTTQSFDSAPSVQYYNPEGERSSSASQIVNEYGNYGENNGPIDDWIERNAVDDPCDEMIPVSKPKDKDCES